MSLNKVMLIGNVGKDPEVRYLEGNSKVASFRIATSERFRDREGRQKEITEWHTVTVWRGLADIVEKYVDIVFANETEAKAFTRLEPREALDEIARHCDIAVVKVGKNGSMVKQGDEYHYIEAWPANTIDATGAGDTYAAGFLYAHSLGMPLKECGEIGSIIAAKVVEVIGTKIDIPRWKAAKQEIRELIAATQSAGKAPVNTQ